MSIIWCKNELRGRRNIMFKRTYTSPLVLLVLNSSVTIFPTIFVANNFYQVVEAIFVANMVDLEMG